MKKLLLVLALSLVASLSVTGVASAAPAPTFKLGFKQLAGLISEIVGQPLENEHYAANGDSIQRTSRGLLVWRKADNWTAFTNGSMTWIFGPHGLQNRPNNARFDWEGQGSGQNNSQGSTATPTPTPAPAPAQGSVLLVGSVASVNGNTVAVTTRDGSVNVDVTSASIQKMEAGAVSDLSSGETVVVMGRQDSGSNFTASNVVINPTSSTGLPGFSGQTPGQWMQGRLLTGTVSSVSGNTVAVQTQQGTTVQVDVSSARIEKTVGASVSDLATGTMVLVAGQRNSDGSVTASNVEIRPTPTTSQGQTAPVVVGTVASVSGNTVAVNARGGSTSVDVTNATIQKTTAGTVADITSGETVLVTGRTGSGGTVAAGSVEINPPTGGQTGFGLGLGFRGDMNVLTGTVSSVSGNTVAVQTQQGTTVQVDVSSARIEKTVSGSVSDLTTGTMVVVTGQRNSDGSVTASNVEIRPTGGPMGRMGPMGRRF